MINNNSFRISENLFFFSTMSLFSAANCHNSTARFCIFSSEEFTECVEICFPGSSKLADTTGMLEMTGSFASRIFSLISSITDVIFLTSSCCLIENSLMGRLWRYFSYQLILRQRFSFQLRHHLILQIHIP